MKGRVYIDKVKDGLKFYHYLRRISGSSNTKRKIKVLAIKGIECYICGDKLSYINFRTDKEKYVIDSFITENGVKLTMDHFIPADIGGAHRLSNLEPCCFTCNTIKGHYRIDTLHLHTSDIMLALSINTLKTFKLL